MRSSFIEKLGLLYEPVAVYFTDEKPEGALQFQKGKRGCVASMLLAAARQKKTAVFDEHTYGCPGGGVGICFGNAFVANEHPTERLLSVGFADLPDGGKRMPEHVRQGERFFASPELVKKWKQAMPYAVSGKQYVVFRPFSQAPDNREPDLLVLFANPDQLSVLITTAGYHRGTICNTVVPFGAACHNILFAYQESKKTQPNAVLGFFDISQRDQLPRELLSFTVPFAMFREMEQGADEGCMTTPAWRQIAGR